LATNAERFLTAYNRIEKHLAKFPGASANYHRGFSDLVRRCAQSSAAVRHHESDLLQFAELRNAIVHDSVDPERAIAEPHDDIVEKIERIAHELTEPELLLPRFGRHVVYVYGSDPFPNLLSLLYTHGFSQFPVFDESGAFKGLLTDRGIARWLARRHGSEYISLSGTKVSEVLAFEQPSDNCRFVAPDTDIYQVKELFVRGQSRQKISAVLITQSGLAQTPLLGIITPVDLVSP
jgi:predicted transcriptional regulator